MKTVHQVRIDIIILVIPAIARIMRLIVFPTQLERAIRSLGIISMGGLPSFSNETIRELFQHKGTTPVDHVWL